LPYEDRDETIYHCKVNDITSNGELNTFIPSLGIWEWIKPADVIRILPKSEVKVTLTLEGTVCRSEDSGSLHDTHFYLHFPGAEDDKDDDRWALVSFNLLSPDQAEMVRELVED